MATYTRLDLRTWQTDSADYTVDSRNFRLINNVSSTAYFTIEGVRYWDGSNFIYKDIFNSSSITDLTYCSVVTGSTNASFVIEPNSTASFNWDVNNGQPTIPKSEVRFNAANSLLYSVADTTASGSAFGVNLDTDWPYFAMTDNNFLNNVNTWFDPATRGSIEAFFGPIEDWNVTLVTNMEGAFLVGRDGGSNISGSFNEDISGWDVSNVSNMQNFMSSQVDFDQNLSGWDVSSVRTMNGMFSGATTFNQPLNTWNVSNVTNMGGMFANASTFNQPLSTLDVSSVTNMAFMFLSASSFNQDIGEWDVSSVNSMESMFSGATSFTGQEGPAAYRGLFNWGPKVENVVNMDNMFNGATSFVANSIYWWRLWGLTTADNFMDLANTEDNRLYYATILDSYQGAKEDLVNTFGLTIGFGAVKYIAGGDAAAHRAVLTDSPYPTGLGWNLSDGGSYTP